MNILTLDFETYFDDDYTLSKMTTEAYVRDPRFEAHGCGIKPADGKPFWVEPKFLYEYAVPLSASAVLCHHVAFDGLILSHHYGIRPARWLDTYSMAQFLFGPEQSKSLGALAGRFGLAPKDVPYDLMTGRHWAEMDRETRDRVAAGALHDCELTHELFHRMMQGDY